MGNEALTERLQGVESCQQGPERQGRGQSDRRDPSQPGEWAEVQAAVSWSQAKSCSGRKPSSSKAQVKQRISRKTISGGL